jgi:hypothetical protein
VIAEAPEMERMGRAGRAKATGRTLKINDDMRARIMSLAAQNMSLRAIARELCVSHESVRSICRSSDARDKPH